MQRKRLIILGAVLIGISLLSVWLCSTGLYLSFATCQHNGIPEVLKDAFVTSKLQLLQTFDAALSRTPASSCASLDFEMLYKLQKQQTVLCQATAPSSSSPRSQVTLFADNTEPGRCEKGQCTRLLRLENTVLYRGNNTISLEVSCPSDWDKSRLQSLSTKHEFGVSIRFGQKRLQACSAWTDQDTILVPMPRRQYFSNLFHTMEEVFAIYETATVLQKDISDMLYFFLWDSGAAIEMSKRGIKRLGNLPAALLRPQVLELWGRLLGPSPAVSAEASRMTGLRTCFRRLVIPMRACRGSVVTATWLRHASCTHGNKLAQAVAGRIVRAFGHPLQPAAPASVVLMIDRAQGARTLWNMRQAEEAVRKLAKRLPSGPEVQTRDLAAMSFAEQVAWMRRTRVLVGAHGAGLTHVMLLPPNSSLVEITAHVPPAGVRDVANIFYNLARWTGRRYAAVHGPGGMDAGLYVEPSELAETVGRLLG